MSLCNTARREGGALQPQSPLGPEPPPHRFNGPKPLAAAGTSTFPVEARDTRMIRSVSFIICLTAKRMIPFPSIVSEMIKPVATISCTHCAVELSSYVDLISVSDRPKDGMRVAKAPGFRPCSRG